MQDLGVLSLKSGFFFNTLLKILWQDIISSISFALIIINLKVVSGPFLSITDLPKTRVFHVFKLLEITMVYKHKNIIPATFKIVLLTFEYLNNSQKFTIIGLISYFSGDYISKEKGY